MTHELTKQQRIVGITAIARDFLHALHIPGGETLSRIVERSIEKRNREAFRVIVSELERGQSQGVTFGEDDVDNFVQMVLRIVDAIGKGTANRNLRLLAQVIVGLKRCQAFEFDRFQKWANVLETLTRNEIILLGRAYNVLQKKGHFWSLLRDELVPKTFSGMELAQVSAALLRTGLLLPVPAIGELSYTATDALRELGELAELRGELDDS